MKILLIEDELEMSSLAVGQLTKLGHEVITAHNLRDAYLRYTEHKETLDLIIADHRLPDGPGVDFILDISYTEDQAKLAIVSGCLTGTDRRLLDERGIPFYMKPVLYSKVANDFSKKITPKAGAPTLTASQGPSPVSLAMPVKLDTPSTPPLPVIEEEEEAPEPIQQNTSLKNKLLSSLTLTDSVEAMESVPTTSPQTKAKPAMTAPPFAWKAAGSSPPKPVAATPVPPSAAPTMVAPQPAMAAPTAAFTTPRPPPTGSNTRPMALRKTTSPSIPETRATPPAFGSDTNPATLRPIAPPPGLVKSLSGAPIPTGTRTPPPPGRPVLTPSAIPVAPPPPPPEEKRKGLSRLFGRKG